MVDPLSEVPIHVAGTDLAVIAVYLVGIVKAVGMSSYATIAGQAAAAGVLSYWTWHLHLPDRDEGIAEELAEA